jgi:hypothetical protein
MSGKHRLKFIHEGKYAAAVNVNCIDADTGWPPYLSVEDAEKLDEVRDALRKGDLKRASQLSQLYQLTPLSA